MKLSFEVIMKNKDCLRKLNSWCSKTEFELKLLENHRRTWRSSVEKTMHTFRGFISSGCHWLKFHKTPKSAWNQKSISLGKCSLNCNRILPYFGRHEFRHYVLRIFIAKKNSCVPNFLPRAVQIFYSSSLQNLAIGVMKNNWKHLTSKCKI